ncbi:hypothetical protein Glove_492g11 [Diversispora epigaea]|uniref:Uncharacterized protein n=1 Tax=Diversispora epigaea TaxID=1348612 RepID=A0A397GII6_9GLOM|nr:hypothetical protein Glove_492g11 [Diversispora epigaea]
MNHIRNFFNPGNNNNNDLEEEQQEENPPLELAENQERAPTPPPLEEATDEQLRETQERINRENKLWEQRKFGLGPFTTQEYLEQDLETVRRLEEEVDRLETERRNRQIAEEQEQIRLAQEEQERKRAYEEQQRTRVTLSDTFLNHPPINILTRQSSPSRRNRPTVNPVVQEVEARVQYIIPLTEEDEETIATPTPIIEENIEENLLNLVNNFNNLNIHIAQNQPIEIEPTPQGLPEETQQINSNNLGQLPTMDAQQLEQLINAITQAITNNQQQNQPAQNQPGPAANTLKISVQIPTFRGDPRENVSAWLMQVQTIFEAQQINDATMRYQYASTGMKGVAMHWYLARIRTYNNQGVP